MPCHVCNVAVGDGQRFCHECGESLDGVTNPTEPLDVLPDARPGVDLDALSDEIDTFLLDAFGVLNIGDTAIEGVPERVAGLQKAGKLRRNDSTQTAVSSAPSARYSR